MSVPRLRFPAFEGEWEEKRLGEIATFQRGFDLPNQDRKEGKIPIVSSGGITGYHDVPMVMGPGIVTGRYGSIGELFYLKEPHWPLNTALWVKDFHGNSIDFAYYHLSRIDFAKLSDKTGVPGINRNDLHRLSASIPSLPEQKKIAAFLGVVDAKIAALRARVMGLQTYKRGLMQALFSRRLRFTKPDGAAFPDWEVKRLEEVFTEITERVGESELPTYSISAGRGFVSQEERFGRDISGQQNERYTAIRVGDFSYNKGNSISYKYGCIYENRTGMTIAVPNVFISFRLRSRKMSGAFFGKLFEDHYLDRGLRTLISSGARMNGLLNVSKDSFFKLTVPVPHPDEQTKIAAALAAMDARIAAVQAQLDKMQAFKRGLLQQMFV